MRAKATLLLASLLLLAPGCVTAEIDAARGDVAAVPVDHGRPMLPLVVGVSTFEDRARDPLPEGLVQAITRSYATVLDRSKLFSRAALARDLAAEGVEPDLLVRGTITRALVERNYAWLTGWGVIAVATLGYGAFVGPLVGLPWARDTADMAIEVRVESARRMAVVTRHRIEWKDKLFLTAYSGEESVTGYAEDPRVPLQELVGRAVLKLADDSALLLPVVEEKRARSREIAQAPAPPPPSVARPAPPIAAPPPPSPPPPPPVAPAEPPPTAQPASRWAPGSSAGEGGVVGVIERVDRDWKLVTARLGEGASVRTDDVLEVLRGEGAVKLVGRVRVRRVVGGGERAAFSAASERGEPIERFRPGDRLVIPAS